MDQLFDWNKSGFITSYLVSGPAEERLVNHETDSNQLRYETYLRSVVTRPQNKQPGGEVRLGENSRLGLPWRMDYRYGSWFVDESTFYSELMRVELDACTVLQAEEETAVCVAVWSYASIDVWCEGIHVGSMSPPVYKPVQKTEIVLNLKKGANFLYICIQTLGVRDTRTLFGIQLLDHRQQVKAVYPDQERTRAVSAYGDWLSGVSISDGVMKFPFPAPEGTQLGYDSMSPDFAREKTRVGWHDVSGRSFEVLEPGKPYIVLRCELSGQVLMRRMEDICAVRPRFLPGKSREENTAEILKRTAEVEALSRGGKFGFSISNILARKALGREEKRDRELFLDTLSQIERRFDCSDFLVCGLIRYIKNYELDEELAEKVKAVLLGYRYWMDQEGSDAMCFWSENHSLMFYVSAMNAGELYPEDYFVRAHMRGHDLYLMGKKRVEQWLDDVEEGGFEEFLSTVYMCVTFAGLLNVIDYTTDEISVRAARVTDRLLTMLALHTFKGCVVAPMGRVYRQIIYPFEQGAQALMNLINPDVPYSYGEGWLAFYATSTYRIPNGLKEEMERQVRTQYSTGNALIRLEKNPYYCLTSVQSPRLDSGFTRWRNWTLEEGCSPEVLASHAYTRSLNERFHGTTCFEPGVYGYQQHMWSAALDPETQVFASHPGGTSDASQMRPGYWYGNGVMPAIRQEQGILGAVYVIPKEHPIHFTHVFWPSVKFDRSICENNWLFGEKDGGFIGIWCNVTYEPWQDQVFDCEYRSYGDEIAYVCICAGKDRYDSLEAFMQACDAGKPVYLPEEKKLVASGMEIIYNKKDDTTQYV